MRSAHGWFVVATLLCLNSLMFVGCAASMSSQEGSLSATTDSNRPTESSSDSTDSSSPKRASSNRRIVRKGDLELTVEEFNSIPERVETVVDQFGGFIATTHVTKVGPSFRRGTWTLRVPTEKFSSLLSELRLLGTVQSTKTSADDVTADYVDIESRIRIKQREEERLVKLLSEATGKLDEILIVERELSRVRGEIEAAQGRAAMLRDLTELATLVVTVTEYRAPFVEPPPTYLDRLAAVSWSSLSLLGSFLQQLTLIAVGVAPWLVFPLVGIAMYATYRRVRRWQLTNRSAIAK